MSALAAMCESGCTVGDGIAILGISGSLAVATWVFFRWAD